MDTRQEYSRCLDHHSHATNRLLRTAAANAALHQTAAGVLLTAPTSTTSSSSSSVVGATTNGGLLRTGLSELSRPGPPHATQAGSVSTPSPIPQCQERYFSSLSVNTGSTYGFLHGDRGMTGALPSPSASLPFRTPPGLSAAASVRHNWSHTPPSPIDSYGRYGIGPSFYSLFPMVTSPADAGSYCMQSAAARLFHKANPYHQFLDATRELGLYHHHLHHGGLPVGSPYSPTLSLDPTDLVASSSSLDIERAGTPMDFMCKNFAAYRDCPSSLVGKYPSPNMGGGGLNNSNGTGVELGAKDANCCGVGNVDVGKPPAAVRGGRSSDGRKSKSSKDDERNRTLLTSPGRCSNHPRNSAVKTFSPPTATAAPFALSKKTSGEVATIFKADTAPPTTTAGENIQRSANVQKVLMEEQRHNESILNRDSVKEEFHYKTESCCSRREKCNSRNGGLRFCSESISTNVVVKPPLSKESVADHFVQVQALNLSQNSSNNGVSESMLSSGTAEEEEISGQTSNDRVKDVPLSLKCSEVPTDKVLVCDKSGIRIKQEGKKEVFSECQFRTDSSGVVTTGTTPRTSKVEPSWNTASSKGGLLVTTGGSGLGNKESKRPHLTAHGKDSKKYGSTKSLEAIVSSIVSSKSNINMKSTDNVSLTTHGVVVSSVSSCCDTTTKVTTTSASKDSLSLSSSSPKSDQSEVQASGDALQLLRACRDVEGNGPNKTTSSHLTESNSFSTVVRSPRRSKDQNDVEKGLDLTKDIKSLTSQRCVRPKHADNDVKPENLSVDKSIKSALAKAPKVCITSSSGPSMSPFHCQPGPNQWPWHGVATSSVCVTKNVSGGSVHGNHHRSKTFHDVKSPSTTLANNNTSSVSFRGIHQHSLKSVEPFSHQYIWQQQQQQQLLAMQVPYDLSINSSVSSSSMAGAHCSTTIATSCSIDSSVTTCQSNMASPVSSPVIMEQMPPTISHGQFENIKSGTCLTSGSESLVERDKVSSEEDSTKSKESNNAREDLSKVLPESSVETSSCPDSARLSAIAELNQQAKTSSSNGKLSKTAEAVDSAVFSHPTTGTTSIPVGIAVARQRQEYHKSNSLFKQKNSKEHHRKPSSVEHSHAQNANHNNRNEDFLREQKELACRNEKTSNGHTIPPTSLETNLIVTGGGPTSPSGWEDGTTKAGTSIQARWMPSTTHGHGVSPQTLWLGQRSYAAAPATMPMQISSLDHPSRQFPPLGYQLARDPITNLFLIPTTNIDLVDRPLVWPSFTTATLATTPPQLPPHHSTFQQYILQQQQQQLLQQEQQRTLEFRLQQESQQEITKNVTISQLIPSNIERNVGLDLSQNGNLCPSIKEETVRCDDLKVKPTTILSTSTPASIIASIPVPGRTFPYVFSASANPVPYYYDHATPATVVHVASATSEDANILLDSEKRSQGTSPVPCPDSCLTPDSDIVCPEPSSPDDEDLGDSEKLLLEQEEVDVLGDSNDSVKLEPQMADACNQTETPPMTDDEEEELDDDDDDEEDDDDDDDDSQLEQKTVEDGNFDKTNGLTVKQEDSSIQCELLSVKSCDLSSSSSLCDTFGTEKKTFSAADVVNGLELLSNTIQEHEKSHGNSCSKDDECDQSPTCNQTEDVLSDGNLIIPLESSTEKVSKVEEPVDSNVSSERLSPKPEETAPENDKASDSTTLGGLGLLCALAEQRILQETQDGSEVESNLDAALKGLDAEMDSDINRNYKILKNQKEYKDFIAHKMQQYSSLGSKFSNNESGGMDAAEFEMRVRLAELQKKYKEKQRELARLLPKKGKEDYEKGSSKRGPGRPRKRKLFSLYKSSKASKHRSHSDEKGSRSRREQSLFGFPSTSSKKFQDYSQLKGSTRIIGKQILKPAVLKPQKSSSDPSMWLLAATSLLAKSDKSTKPLGGIVPFQSGFTNISMTSPSFGKTTPIKSATLLQSSISLSYKMSPTESNEISISKDVVATPDESSSEPSDSDDSYSCSQRKRKNKRSVMTKDLVLKHTKRKETFKSSGGRLDGKKFGRWGEDDDSVDLSVSFSSLSVSCTMPPFQGCEESTGLGLLAKYASQVVEQTESSSKTGQQPQSEGEWISDQEGATTSASGVSESRKRKPGRPKKHSPIKPDAITETIVAKKPKTLNFIKLDPTTCMPSSKLPPKNSSKSSETNVNNSDVKYSFLEDEAWLRRRSERIFLNEPRINPHSWNVLDDTPSFSSLKSKPEQQTKSEQLKPKKKHNKIKTESELNAKKPKVVTKQSKEKDNPELKSEIEPCIPVVDTVPSIVKDSEEDDKTPLAAAAEVAVAAAPDESDSDSPENSSFSEGDNLPLSKLIERPITPEPRSCVIKAEELRDSLRVLTMMDGLFYAGYINAIRAPDVYGITVDGERGNRPHIYSREEVLQEAIYEVKPCSIRYLPEGTRVCAFWSQQYRCLYPGTVTRPSSPNSSPVNNSVNVEFDDGDSGRIEIDNVRLLPPDLPIISYEPDPLVVGKRRTKSTGDLSREKRPPLVPITSQSKKLSSLKSSKPNTITNKSTSNNDDSKLESGSDTWTNNAFPTLPPSTEIQPTSTLTIISTPLPKNTYSSWKTNKSKPEETTKSVIITSKPPICSSNVTTLAEVIKSSTAVTTITSKTIPPASITVIAIGSGPPLSSNIMETTATLKSKKHKKHRDREKTDDRKHHHHHHHHHKHRRKHEKRDDDKKVVTLIESMTKPAEVIITNTNVGVTTATTVSKLATTNTENDSKKSELTLTIKTNNSNLADTSRLDADAKKNGAGGKKRALSVDAVSCRSDDHEASSQSSSNNSSDDVSSEKSDKKPLPPPSKKAKTTKDDSTNNNNSNGSQKNPPKTKKGKEKVSNVESKSKMAAFLPARQLWKWAGKSFKCPGKKGKAKKEFYKSITRGKETIRVGDSAVFLSTGRPHLPYIGRIEMMWESWGGNMVVKVKWFYHPEETKGGRRLADTKGALYQSLHVDENDVQTISHKCEVLSWEEYSKLKKEDGNQKSKYGASLYDNNDVYYLAGTYDPMTLVVTLEPGVS